MRFLITFCMLVLFVIAQTHASTVGLSSAVPSAIASKVRAQPIGPATPFPAISSLGKDIKPPVIPTKIPKPSKYSIDPNLREFFTQLDKYNSLMYQARQLEPWVYTRAIEGFVADYEDATRSLDLCDSCLDEALYRLATATHRSMEMDPALDLAKSEMAKVEHMLDLLVEVAKFDLYH